MLSSAPTRRARHRSVPVVVALAIGLVAGLAASVIAGTARRDAVLAAEHADFERSAADFSAAVATSLRRNADVVASAGALIAADAEVTNAEFATWFEQATADRYPGLRGFGYIQRVPDAELVGFVAVQTADPFPSSTGTFALLPPGQRAEYCLARLGTFDQAELSVRFPPGLDLCVMPGFGELLAEVRRSGHFALVPVDVDGAAAEQAEGLRAYAESIVGSAFYVIAPVRAPGSAAADPGRIRGWILAVFDGPSIVAAIPGLDGETDLELSWRDDGEAAVIAERSVAIDGARFDSTQTFAADGEWTMRMRRSAAGAVAAARGEQRIVTAAGIAFTLLLLAFAWMLIGARNRALRLVDLKTDELRHRALHDALTELPNRVLILDRAEQLLHRARREGFPAVAMFLDVDDFKTVNDTLGHAAGDELLRAVARRLCAAVRDADSVGRLGGDEFIVLADGSGSGEGLAQRLLEVMAEPIHLDELDNAPLTVGVSIGIAVGDRPNADTLLRDADVALYRAKAAGKGGYVVFEPDTDGARSETPAIELRASATSRSPR